MQYVVEKIPEIMRVHPKGAHRLATRCSVEILPLDFAFEAGRWSDFPKSSETSFFVSGEFTDFSLSISVENLAVSLRKGVESKPRPRTRCASGIG